MKGIVFQSFIEFTEDRFGVLEAQEMIQDAKVPANGVFSSFGDYDFGILVQMLMVLHRRSGESVQQLLENFGRFMFSGLTHMHPYLTKRFTNGFDLLESLHSIIHAEVKKLHSGVELPDFTANRQDERTLEMTYHSKRKLATFAIGLIHGCGAHFGEIYSIEHTALDESGENHRFMIVRNG